MILLVRRYRASLALLAAFLTAAAPVLAHAHLALGAHPGYEEICTDQGLARVPAGDGPQGERGRAVALAHCALCVAPGGDQVLAGGGPAIYVVDREASPIIVPADRSEPVDPLHGPRPRGPPATPVAIA
jgi:hypothetical protein